MAADTLIVNTGNIGRLFVEFLAGRGTEIVHRSQNLVCGPPASEAPHYSCGLLYRGFLGKHGLAANQQRHSRSAEY